MRLSDFLSKAPQAAPAQVEGFLGGRRCAWGKSKSVRVGRVALNFPCGVCGDFRTFMSGEELSCLITGDKTVSIDATLKCSACDRAYVETWFLVTCDEDLYAQAPVVRLERYTEHRREGAITINERLEDLLERARIAHSDGLGAGAMIYLRMIFEEVTAQVAQVGGIPTRRTSGRRVPFRELLEIVNERYQIIPQRFARDGYLLFNELSEVIHGAATEQDALAKYAPCRQLVVGVVENVKRDREITRAIDALGWNVEDGAMTSSGGMSDVQN